MKEVLRSIDDAGMFAIVGILIFFVFFVGLLIWVARMDKDHIKEMSHLPTKGGKILSIFLLFAASCMPAFAQTAEVEAVAEAAPDPQVQFIKLILWIAIGLSAITLALILLVWVLIKDLILPKTAEGKSPTLISWKGIMKSLTKTVPLEMEEEIELDHCYDDDIRELDNRLPPWWLYGFYLSIVIAFGYMWYYHASSRGISSQKVYEKEMVEANAQKKAYLAKMANLVDEESVEVLTDAFELGKGKTIYTKLCVACHMADGGGGIGPNLTDEYWLHGGDIKSIFSTVKYGVPEKGMISWQDQLNPQEMHQVSSYIHTLKGTTPANPKEPQGEKEVAGEATEVIGTN